MAGKYFDELEGGAIIRHELRRTLTNFDNVLFGSLTLHINPVHIHACFAATPACGKQLE